MQRASLSLSMAEDDTNSASSHDDGSSADETTPAVASSSQKGSEQVVGKKRKRAKYQKTSYVLIASPPLPISYGTLSHLSSSHYCIAISPQLISSHHIISYHLVSSMP